MSKKVYSQSDPRIPIESCDACGNATGRAGKSEDSLYCADCGDGPFCENCFDTHMDNHNQI